MRVPSDVTAKQAACGFVDLAWIGSHEIVLEYGNGSMLVKAFDHHRGQLVLEGVYLSVGKARAAFDRARVAAVKRESMLAEVPFMKHSTPLNDRMSA